MNFKKLSIRIAEEFNLTRAESGRIAKTIFNEISKDLTIGERAYFRNFGAFHKITRPAKKYRNIKTGQIETKPEYNTVEFRPSTHLTKMMQNK